LTRCRPPLLRLWPCWLLLLLLLLLLSWLAEQAGHLWPYLAPDSCTTTTATAAASSLTAGCTRQSNLLLLLLLRHCARQQLCRVIISSSWSSSCVALQPGSHEGYPCLLTALITLTLICTIQPFFTSSSSSIPGQRLRSSYHIL
jgi:hypothetical protein